MAGDVSIPDCESKTNESSCNYSELTIDENKSIPTNKDPKCGDDKGIPETSSKTTNICDSSFRDQSPELQDLILNDNLLSYFEAPPGSSSKQMDVKLAAKNLVESFNDTKTSINSKKIVNDALEPKVNTSESVSPFDSGTEASSLSVKHPEQCEVSARTSKSEESAGKDDVCQDDSDDDDDSDDTAYEDDSEVEENSPTCSCVSSCESNDDIQINDDFYQDIENALKVEPQKFCDNGNSNDNAEYCRKRKIEEPATGDQKRLLLSDANGNGIGSFPGPFDLERLSLLSNSVSLDSPDLNQWLNKFNSWTNSEQLTAIDALISGCASDQVRHMMEAIEPLFQRDFISLLPRELALTVLGHLDAADLLKAAQTCRYWRFLADDNLIWKEQCRKAGITQIRRKTGLMPTCLSPWKVTYMHQYLIENNWLKRPLRTAKVLKGHDDHVITCLQFYGNKILSGSDDTTLKVWSAITGRCLRTLVGHTGGVWSSQMVGRVIVSGSTDRTLRVWDARTGECLKILVGHISTIRCMHLHQDRVVSGSRDATLRVWSITDGKCLQVLVGHMAAVRCVQYDGKYIVSGAYDYFVKVWNPETGDCLHTLTGHTNRVYSLQFDGVHVVSGSLDTSIRVWDVESGALKHTLMGHQSLTSGMELRSNILVSGNADSTVKIWDITTGRCLHTLTGPNKHQSAVTCVQSNKRFVITSSDDGTVKLWDIRTGEYIRNLITLTSGGSGGVVWRIRASSTKLVCAVGSRNGTEETKLLVFDFNVPGACQKCID